MNTKKLGLGSAVAVCVGLIVATSCLVSLGTGIGLAGRWFLIPMAVVMVLNSFVGLSYSELHGLMPKCNGGTSQYLLAGVGPFFSLVGNTAAYVITMILSACAEISMCAMVMEELFLHGVDYRIIAMGILLLFFVVNWFGVDLFARIQDIIVILLIGSMLVLGILGMAKAGTGTPVSYPDPSLAEIGGLGGLMKYAAIAFWLFIGVEFVIPVANDMKNPKRDVLLSISLGLLLLLVVQSVLGWGMTNYVTMDDLAAATIPHMTYAVALLGKFGRYWMGVITLLASVSTMNTVFAASSKIIQGMAEERMLPKFFGKTNRHNACVPGLAVMAVGIGALILSNAAASNSITFLILAASCFWLLTYCFVHLSVLSLRRRYPEAPRRKWLTLGGIPQILAIAGNLYMIWNIETGEARIKIYQIFGIIMAVLSVYALIWLVGVLKVPAFRPLPVEFINEGKTLADLPGAGRPGGGTRAGRKSEAAGRQPAGTQNV
ncbi:MAG: APC family permease [Clostridia bacterium]|nr:APC family permease [Clostridia bacterium]